MCYELLMLQTVNMVMGNPSTCTQAIKLMVFEQVPQGNTPDNTSSTTSINVGGSPNRGGN